MDWQRIIYSLPAILIGLTVHEYCHAWAAYRLGDTTARDQGRLSLNPLRHIDPLGLVFIVFAGFGWAKPVQFSPETLGHPRRDKALIAAAGPLANLVLGIGLILLFRGLNALIPRIFDPAAPLPLLSQVPFEAYQGILSLFIYGAFINTGLFVFNLLPVPPLDGSHIFFSGLNLSEETERRIMRIGAPLLFIILIIQNRTDLTILPVGKLVEAIMSLFL
jgi:Zn-dependent protease